AELINRNFLGKSFRPTIEICGIAFLWMAFIGLIPLYQNSGLMRLDFLLSKAKGAVFEVLFFINKIFSLMLGIVMVIAFIAQYPFVSTRFYSTFQFQLPYTVQYFPMAVAGVFMALKTLEQIVERILMLCGKLPKE
ncbi:MAG: TRAP transporter small permease, partial [Ruminiclostridium sp.]|nr:TRAP transporter small permease [Ruminiclostridium sp.]